MSKGLTLWHKAAIGLGTALFFIMLFSGRHAPAVEGDSAFRTCVREKGQPSWRGSSGISLEDYCRGLSGLEALERDVREHPERH